MKRICNLATIHRRDNARIFRKECSIELQRYEVHYVTCDGEGDQLKDGIYVHGIRKYKTKILRAIFAPFEIYRKAKLIDACIYILHDPELLLIALLLKRTKTVVWDCHEYFVEEIMTKKWLCFLARVLCFLYLKCAYRFIIPRLDGVILVSEGMQGSLKSLQLKNVFVLHNYALLKEFKDLRAPDFDHAECILYTGTLWSALINVIRALELCKNPIKFALCGKTSSSHDWDIFSGIELPQNVCLMENVSIEEIKTLSTKCFTGICAYDAISSKADFSSVKLYEYAAQTLPSIVLASRENVSLKNFLKNDGHPLGLLVDYDPQAIADAIDYLYENKEVARTMGMNGRKAFETKYNFESEADGFLKFLEEVSQSKKSKK